MATPREDALDPRELPLAVPRALQEYMRAFVDRDLERCTSCYGEEAVIQFQFSRYRGRDSIGAWHRERFDANLRVLRLDDVVAEQDEVTVDAVVASDRLAQWRFDSMSVRLVFHLEAGRIRELKCEMRVTPW